MRKITIPTNLNEISLNQFIKLQSEIKEDNDFHTAMAMIRILCGLNSAEVLAMPSKDFDDIVDTLTKTLKQDPKHSQTFGKYGFIPNFDNITTAELIDIETFLKDNDIAGVVGVLYRPIETQFKDYYTIVSYDLDKVNKEEILALPCTAYLGAIGFFLTLLNELLIYIPNYMNQMEMTAEEMKILQKNGVGIHQLMQSLTETCESMKQSLKSMFTLSSII
jgi:hypothetical protein